MINSCEFGHIVIDNEHFNEDVIILPGGKIVSWWRKSGHNVVNEDLQEVHRSGPAVIIFGTGQSGMMKVSEEVREYCSSHNIKLVVEKTDVAVRLFDEENSEDKVGGFHLTC